MKQFSQNFRFSFSKTGLFPHCTQPYALNKKNNPLNYYSLKVTKFPMIVSKMRVLGQKTTGGGGAKRPPPPQTIPLNKLQGKKNRDGNFS